MVHIHYDVLCDANGWKMAADESGATEWGQGPLCGSSPVGVVMADVRQEIENAVRDGRKDCFDSNGNLVCRYTIEQA